MHHDFGYCSAGGASRTCISSCMFGWWGVVSTCWISESWNCNSEIWRTWINTYENYVWWLPYYTINHGHIIIFSTMVYVYEMTINHGIWWLLVCLRSRIARCCCPCTPPGSVSEIHRISTLYWNKNWKKLAARCGKYRHAKGAKFLFYEILMHIWEILRDFESLGISEFYAGSGLQDLDTCAARSSRHLSSHQVMLGSRIPKDPWGWHQLVLKNGGYPVPQFMNFKPWDVACDVWRHVEAPSGEERSALFGA